MFPTLLSNLQTLISSRFLVASFFPTMAFWFANATMMFLLNAPFAEYVTSQVGQTAGLTSIVTAAALIAVAFSAYAEAALLPTIQSLMEGNWPAWLAAIFAQPQMKQYEKLDREIAENLALQGGFVATAAGQKPAQRWKQSLTAARRAGNQVHANAYTLDAPSARAVATLAGLRRQARPITAAAIEAAVNGLAPDLRANDADLPGPNGDAALETTRQLLWDLIEYADQYSEAQYRALLTRRQFSFGLLPVVPTRMGNVAKTVQGYAVRRYDFNFALLWSRLQLAAQKDKDFGPVLQAAKTQLDFLLSCSALTFLWAIPWSVWLYATAGPRWVFLAVALLGPLTSYVWYRVAVSQYRTLADLLRSSIDLFRFDMLTALHYPLPGSADEELFLWQTVDAMHVLYERHDLRYVNPKS